jgi:hypothetical protein
MSSFDFMTIAINHYRPEDHYWVAGEGLYFSSKLGGHVDGDNPDFVAWKEAGGVPTAAYPQGVDGPGTIKDMWAEMSRYKLDKPSRLQKWVDAYAKAKGYDDIATMCSYKDSTNTAWAREAGQAISLRDNAWSVYFANENEDWPKIEERLPAPPAGA